MNILPMILFSIIALAAFVTAFMQKSTDLTIAHRTISAFTTAARKCEQKAQETAFEQLRKERGEKKETKPKNDKEEDPEPRKLSCPRTTAQMTDAAKINIYPLFLDAKQKEVTPIFSRLLTELYGHIYSPEHLEALITALIEAGREHLDEQRKHAQSRELDLNDLYPKDNALHGQFYQILRGTKHYKLETHEGYPPLSHFICLQENEKIGYFSTLSPAALKALFGEEAAQKIVTKEQELRIQKENRQQSLTKAQLLEYIAETSLAELLHFKNPSAKKLSDAFQDADTLITFNIKRSK